MGQNNQSEVQRSLSDASLDVVQCWGAVAVIDALGFRGIWNRVQPTALVARLQAIRNHVSMWCDEHNAAVEGGRTRFIAQVLSDTVVVGAAVANERMQAIDADAVKYTLIHFASDEVGELVRAALEEEPYLAFRGCLAVGELWLSPNEKVGETVVALGPAIDEAVQWHEEADAAVVWLTPTASSIAECRPKAAPQLWSSTWFEWEVPLRHGGKLTTMVVNTLLDEMATGYLDGECPYIATLRTTFNQSPEVQVKWQNTREMLNVAGLVEPPTSAVIEPTSCPESRSSQYSWGAVALLEAHVPVDANGHRCSPVSLARGLEPMRLEAEHWAQTQHERLKRIFSKAEVVSQVISNTFILGCSMDLDAVDKLMRFPAQHLSLQVVCEMAGLLTRLGIECDPLFSLRGCIDVGAAWANRDVVVGQAIDTAAEWYQQSSAAVIWLTPAAATVANGKFPEKLAPNYPKRWASALVPFDHGRALETLVVDAQLGDGVPGRSPRATYASRLLRSLETTLSPVGAIQHQNTLRILALLDSARQAARGTTGAT